jgi:nicotinamidase-related amidase
MATIDLPVRYHRFYPAEAPQGVTAKTVSLKTEETALLLIDLYHAAQSESAKDLVHTAWDAEWWRIIHQNMVPLIGCARRLGLPIVYTTNSSPRIEMGRSAFGMRLRESLGFDPEVDFRQPSVDPIEFEGGEAVQLVFPPQVAPGPDDYYIRKHTFSGFFETRLDSVLRNLGVHTLLCAGFVADCCVFFTLGDAVFRGYHTILMRDCTLAAELPHEVTTFIQTQRTILWIESILGPTTTTADLLQAVAELA